MIVVIDDYDSFIYNLVQYFQEFDPDVRVYRNDAITVARLSALGASHLVISPGPGIRTAPEFRWKPLSISRGKFRCWGFVWGTKRWDKSTGATSFERIG